MVGNTCVHHRDTGDIDDHDLGTVCADAPEQLLSQLAGALGIHDADDWQDEQTLADLQHRRGEDSDGLLLLADDALALLDEADGHGDGDAVGSWLVCVQDAVQQREIRLIFRKQGARKNVAEQQDNPYHFACFHTSGNDALGQIPRVRLECLESSGFQRLHVVVIDGSRFGKDFFLAHCCQQLCLSDALGPFFAQLGAALSEVFNQLAE